MAYNQPYNYGYGYPQYQNGAVPDMLNQYKGQYQQMPMQPVQQPIQSSGGLIWVDNEEQAKNYLVAPNNVIPMFDKSSSAMYIKSADGAGMPTFKRYKLIDIDEEKPKNAPETHKCTCGDKFVTKEEFDALKGKFCDILAKYDGLLLEQKQKEKENEIEKPKTSKKVKESEE
jgi:hypothetical protein